MKKEIRKILPSHKIKLILPLFIILIIGLLGGIIIYFSRQKETSIKDIEWGKYKNSECKYEISYPKNWILKVNPYKDSCETKQDAYICVTSHSFYLLSKKRSKFSFKNPRKVDILPSEITSFSLSCLKTMKLHDSTTDWVKNSWLVNHDYLDDDETIEKYVQAKIKEEKFGDTKIQVFKASDSRIYFIYKGHIYEISLGSGSKEQFEKDKEILDKISQSFKIF